MAEPLAAAIYASQLTNQKVGYPLWDPDPHSEPAVEIADVGYVENGAWVRLFNGSKALGDSSNKFGVPDGYRPLQVGAIQERTSLLANVPIQSESILQLGMQANISGGAITQAAGGFSFECFKEQGAVLVLGDDADRRDALRKYAFVRYIRENHAAWLEFANGPHERGITLSDLVLVTGCDKTSVWACAAFSAKSSQAGISINIGQPGFVQGGASISWAWKNCSSVAISAGPRGPARLAEPSSNASPVSSDRPIQVNGEGGDAITGHVATVQSPPTRNQCVFLRGYKICDRNTGIARRLWRKRKPVYDGFSYISHRGDKEDPDSGPSGSRDSPSGPSGNPRSPQQPPSGRENDKDKNTGSSSGSGSQPEDHSNSSGSSETDSIDSVSFGQGIDDGLAVSMQLNSQNTPAPLDFILEYILENSVVELALVHDDDLITLLQGVNFVNNFEEWICRLAPRIFVVDQVGMLETTYQISLSHRPSKSAEAVAATKPLASLSKSLPILSAPSFAPPTKGSSRSTLSCHSLSSGSLGSSSSGSSSSGPSPSEFSSSDSSCVKRGRLDSNEFGRQESAAPSFTPHQKSKREGICGRNGERARSEHRKHSVMFPTSATRFPEGATAAQIKPRSSTSTVFFTLSWNGSPEIQIDLSFTSEPLFEFPASLLEWPCSDAALDSEPSAEPTSPKPRPYAVTPIVIPGSSSQSPCFLSTPRRPTSRPPSPLSSSSSHSLRSSWSSESCSSGFSYASAPDADWGILPVVSYAPGVASTFVPPLVENGVCENQRITPQDPAMLSPSDPVLAGAAARANGENTESAGWGAEGDSDGGGTATANEGGTADNIVYGNERSPRHSEWKSAYHRSPISSAANSRILRFLDEPLPPAHLHHHHPHHMSRHSDVSNAANESPSGSDKDTVQGIASMWPGKEVVNVHEKAESNLVCGPEDEEEMMSLGHMLARWRVWERII